MLKIQNIQKSHSSGKKKHYYLLVQDIKKDQDATTPNSQNSFLYADDTPIYF